MLFKVAYVKVGNTRAQPPGKYSLEYCACRLLEELSRVKYLQTISFVRCSEKVDASVSTGQLPVSAFARRINCSGEVGGWMPTTANQLKRVYWC